MKNGKLLLGLSSMVVLMLHQGATWAATAGYVQFANGQVSLTTAKGVTHAVQKGEPVSEGDTVSTARNASAQIRMQDGGFIAVRPDTQLKFDSFKFTGKAGQPESSFFSLFKGGFRAVTGLIGRVNKKDYRINTPAATIGIRGTDHETMYLPANIPGAMAGAYSKVNLGETTLTTNRGTINVLPNQMGFAGGLNHVPQLQPINTTIFTVAVAPREVKVGKEGKEQGGGQAQQASPAEKKEAAATQQQQPAAEAGGEKAPAASEPIRGTALVDNTELAPDMTATVTASPAAPESVIETASQTVLPVTASSGALTLNASDQTVVTGGSIVPVQNGIYSMQAKTAADSALAAEQAAAAAVAAAASAKTALLAIATVGTTTATSAITTADSAISVATPQVTSAGALTPADVTTTVNNAQAAAATSATQAAAAQAALTANGTFADTTATTANNAVQAANTAVQTAQTAVQTNAAAVTTQNTVLTNAQTAATAALSSANSSVAMANSNLGSVAAQNAAITTAQSGAAALLSTAQAAATAASAAAQAAQAAATLVASLQSAGDLAGAAAQLKIAQDQLVIAQAEQANAQAAQAALATKLTNAQTAQTTANNALTSAVSAANAAAAAAGTAQTQAANAGSASTAANNALTQTVAEYTGLQTQAAIIASNAPIAGYNNPAVASSNFTGHLAMPAPVTGGYHIAHESTNSQQSNTQFVLDGNGNLVEMRSTSFQVQPVLSTPATSLADADVKWSGGTPADTFKLADNSIYAGRWVGATVTVTDQAATAPMAPFSLTPANSLWTVLLTPATGYVQSLVASTSYTKVAATQPFDASGNLGTLTAATLNADFTSQLVSATLDLTMPSGTMAGTYTVAANNMPINTVASGNGSAGFGGSTTTPAVSCSGACAAGASGYSANVGGSFAGTGAASAGLGYDIWPIVISPNMPVTNLVQGMVAFSAATAPTTGTNPVTGVYVGGLNRSIIVGGGVFKAESPAVAIDYTLYPNIGYAHPNTNFILDASGNLIRVLSTSYSEYPVMPNAYVTPIADAQINFAGGVAADYYKAADNSLTFGRWQGGNITITDNVSGTSVVKPLLAANGLTPLNMSWYLFVPTVANYTQGLTGTITYSNVAAVQPVDTLGNVGTLNTATLSANFTAMTVDATANLTIASKTFDLQSLGLPIVADAFSADPQYVPGAGGATGPMATTTCAGATCAAGYQSRFGGIFTGDTASNALVHYDIWPTTTAGAAATDNVQGLIAFNTATAPPVAPPAAYNPSHVAVEIAGGVSMNTGMLAIPADLTYVSGGAGNLSSSGALSSMTFRDFGGGSAYTSTSTITGGTATSANAPAFATTGIQYGEWTGYTGQSNSWSSQLGGKGGSTPTSWMYGPQGYLDAAYVAGPSVIGAMAATFTYQMDGGTAPHSQMSGLSGTLTSASFTADFVNMLLTGNLALTMPGDENWGASVANAPMVIGSPFSATPVVTYSVGAAVPLATCATCGGSVSGDFTGQNFAGAILSYNLYNNTPGGGDVSGNVALTRVGVAGNATVTNGTAAPTGNIVVATADQGGAVSTYPLASSTTAGNLLTAFGGTGYSTTVTCTTCTTTASGQVASSGIYYGNWSAGSITQSYSATFPAGTMPPSYWITGPEAGPMYLPQALTGTASYAFNAGQVSNSMGVAGTVQGTTALSLDFNKQTVGINLDVTIQDMLGASHTWKAATVAAGDVAVLGNGQGISGAAFSASTSNSGSGSGLLTVTVDGSAANVANARSDINGQLTGNGLNGAIMSFNLGGQVGAGPTFENINGVAAFTGTAANTATSHRYVSFSSYDPFAPLAQPALGFYANNSARVTQDATGNLTQFDTQVISSKSSGSSMTFARNTSTLTDYGTDAVSGISWGRWAGGTVNATDRQTGVVTPTTLAGSMHWIAEPVATAATTLPTTGTYTYTHAGGTLPTDNLGNVGTLNSASLTANFTAQTVNLGVNATVAGATLNAAGTNVPIIQKTVFYASSQEPAASTSHLTVTCTGTCGALGGTVVGKFSGAGAIGAAMSYGLQNGSSTISGVAAFHR